MASMDFYGFSFNGTHSSTLGILRVSSGNRYNDTILPVFQDKTVPVPGGDGTYFFDSFYTNRTFSLNIAFDNMSEAQFRRLRQVFSTKNMGPLIFDEAPYKVYTAKIQSPPQLNYICFDVEEENSEATSTLTHNHDLGGAMTIESRGSVRIYKGEGTIQFICYYPFAHSLHKYLNEYDEIEFSNKGEWEAASGMLNSAGSGASAYDGTGEEIRVYNPGDIEADFMSYYAISASTPVTLTAISYTEAQGLLDNPIKVMTFNQPIVAQSAEDAYIRINSKTNLIEGCDANYQPTGTLYNSYVSGGDFFKIPVSASSDGLYKYKSAGQSCVKIEYNYLYY